jgi:hypothetical protein
MKKLPLFYLYRIAYSRKRINFADENIKTALSWKRIKVYC